jgi:Uri superfamily endonuclease
MIDVTGNCNRDSGGSFKNRCLPIAESPITYQLTIRLTDDIRIAIGALGTHRLPAGDYVYTGSARRNLEARIARHCRRDKKLHWHIDYLLAAAETRIIDIQRLAQPECFINQQQAGRTLIPGFGASDCRGGCGSHLKHLGNMTVHD